MAKKNETVTVLVRGSNKLVLDEADRSIHDALCVIRCLVKKRCVFTSQYPIELGFIVVAEPSLLVVARLRLSSRCS